MLDLAIIGGGPAGMTAGLYATRGGLKNVVMYELGMPGGQNTQSSEIENYPGQKEIVSGMELMNDWPEQSKAFGLKHSMNEVVKITKSNDIFSVILGNGDTVQSKTVIMATGSKPKKAGLKGEDKYFGKGVSTCATCDGFFYKNQEVVVVGGGDTALEEAIHLAHICKTVHLTYRGDKFRASPNTVDRVLNLKNIKIYFNTIVDEILGDSSGVSQINIKNTKTDKLQELKLLGIFIFVGRDVLNEPLRQDDGGFLCDTNQSGEIVVDLKMQTSVPGLFACGDIRIDAPKQVVCAAGDGAVAGIGAISYLS
jgi:thioredoxin reductase (NADPH)